MLLAEEFEEDIKKIKDTVYRLSWYMRGGLSVETLMYNTDVMDQDVISRIIKDNIENTKNSKIQNFQFFQNPHY